MNVVGFDIGGANTKAAFISTKDGAVTRCQTAFEYFPFWKRNLEQLGDRLSLLKTAVAGKAELDCVAATLTAELSDAFRTKREGVDRILDCVGRAFPKTKIAVLTADARLISKGDAKAEPLRVAAANWAATGWMVSQRLRDCVVIDVGSTSTSIIPIANGRVVAEGKTDLEKLGNGELIYTGSLRTNVAATVQTVRLRGGLVRVSSELFAQTGDIHLVLGNITAKQYSVETADGKSKSRTDALTRVARVVCADTEMLTEEEIIQIARYVYAVQVEQIADALNQVYSRLKENAKTTVAVVVTGLGKMFLAKKAAVKAEVRRVIDFDELFAGGSSVASPAIGLALMAATELEGKSLEWTL